MDQAMIQTDCFSEETLQFYWDGRLSDSTSKQVELHLLECSVCSSILQEIEIRPSEDSLVAPLRGISQSSSAPSEPGPKKEKSRTIGPSPFLILPQGTRIGPYQLLDTLGVGGMGTVFLAEHTVLRRNVALKLIHLHHHTAASQARFEREIHAAGRLRHPSIIGATDAGRHRDERYGDILYLVMEHVQGLDLARISKSKVPIPIADVAEIGRQIALALSYAHGEGVVHRDIKPSNVMLDEAGNVKVLDFGLAMMDRWDGPASELTTIGQFLGTLDYMAPEQAERCGAVDYRADLYSLGATLFKLLCGRAPLAITPNLSPIEKLRLLADHRPPKLKALRTDAPESLCNTVDALLATEPKQRPASAAHVAELLQPHSEGANLSSLLQSAQSAAPSYFEEELSAFSILRMPETSSKGGGKRWVGIAIAAAALPLAIWFGWSLILDSKNGQLVIESELPETAISIKKESGEVEQKLSIEPGNTVTKLKSGVYTLELAAPSSSVEIENGTFSIRDGETIIARVRQGASTKAEPPTETVLESSVRPLAEAHAPIPPPASTSIARSSPAPTPTQRLPPGDEPMYQGRTKSELLSTLERETSLELWSIAAKSLSVLVEAEKCNLADEKRILESSLKMGVLTYLGPLTKRAWMDVRIVQELDRSSHEDRQRLLIALSGLYPQWQGSPMVHWVERYGLKHGEENSKDLQLAIFGLYRGTLELGRFRRPLPGRSATGELIRGIPQEPIYGVASAFSGSPLEWSKRTEQFADASPHFAQKMRPMLFAYYARLTDPYTELNAYWSKVAFELLFDDQTDSSVRFLAFSRLQDSRREAGEPIWDDQLSERVLQLLQRPSDLLKCRLDLGRGHGSREQRIWSREELIFGNSDAFRWMYPFSRTIVSAETDFLRRLTTYESSGLKNQYEDAFVQILFAAHPHALNMWKEYKKIRGEGDSQDVTHQLLDRSGYSARRVIENYFSSEQVIKEVIPKLSDIRGYELGLSKSESDSFQSAYQLYVYDLMIRLLLEDPKQGHFINPEVVEFWMNLLKEYDLDKNGKLEGVELTATVREKLGIPIDSKGIEIDSVVYTSLGTADVLRLVAKSFSKQQN